MDRKKIAICENCKGYRERFVKYLMEHKAKEMEIEVYSVPEKLLEALVETTFAVVLLGEGFQEIIPTLEERQQAYVYLTENMPECVSEADVGKKEKDMIGREMFRYQSVEKIVHEMEALAHGTKEAGCKEEYRKMHIEIIGVCSACKHEMQMPFSVVLAGELAKERNVLYLNFLEHAAFMELFELQGKYDMGDTILLLRNQRLECELLWKTIYEWEGISYIPPFQNPENLYEMTIEDYLGFLNFLEKYTEFETVVVDFGGGIRDYGKWLACCTSIYCVTKPGYYYEAQLQVFLKYLASLQNEEKEDNISIVTLPYSAKHIRGGCGLLQQLRWSEFGDYVRGEMYGNVNADVGNRD